MNAAMPGVRGEAPVGVRERLRGLGGGLRSWLAVRGTRAALRNLTALPLQRLAAPATGDP
jgi:hypothetical protein